jgi:hypothetical protein
MRTRLCALLALALAGCASAPIPLVNSPIVPAASGEITTTEEGNNHNLRLEIEVKHLAPPEKVEPGATVYVVWVEVAGATPQNVGSLRVDDDLAGKLDTTTPFHRFNLAITAEREPAAVLQRGARVLSATVDR